MANVIQTGIYDINTIDKKCLIGKLVKLVNLEISKRRGVPWTDKKIFWKDAAKSGHNETPIFKTVLTEPIRE